MFSVSLENWHKQCQRWVPGLLNWTSSYEATAITPVEVLYIMICLLLCHVLISDCLEKYSLLLNSINRSETLETIHWIGLNNQIREINLLFDDFSPLLFFSFLDETKAFIYWYALNFWIYIAVLTIARKRYFYAYRHQCFFSWSLWARLHTFL